MERPISASNDSTSLQRVAVVTGASRGIGEATALAAAAQGYAVCVNYRSDTEKAQEVADRIISDGGKAIAHATAMVHARHGAEPAARYRAEGDEGDADPGPMGPHVSKTPYMGRREMHIEHMADSQARIVLPFIEANADLEEGIHEGAVLALLDTCGAMASWAETGPGAFKASTPSLQAQILCPSPKQDLVAYGRVIQRDASIFWADAVVAGAADGLAVARGTGIYRSVT